MPHIRWSPEQFPAETLSLGNYEVHPIAPQLTYHAKATRPEATPVFGAVPLSMDTANAVNPQNTNGFDDIDNYK